MSTRWDAVVAALWRSLDLDPPGPGASAPTLRVDGHVLALAPAANGTHVVISARIGTLAADGFTRTGQLRRLMRDGLGAVLTSRAGLRLADGSNSQVEAVALCPCRTDALPRLRETIEDVLRLLDVHAPTLDEAGRPSRPDTGAAFSASDSMIFRL